MYDCSALPRQAGRELGVPGAGEHAERARLALARARNLLTAFTPGLCPDRGRLLDALATGLNDREAERLTLRGWLLWLLDRHPEAAACLEEAEARCLGSADKDALALAAYWLARVRLRLRREALAPFEGVLRKLGGSPQAAAWFVDLLWRAGRVERAEQVWKSVRANKRVLGCDEGPLIDARLHLRRGEFGPAERLLREMTPRCGPVAAERHLLLAWMKRGEKAAEELTLAEAAPYPAAALAEWRRLVEARDAGAVLTADDAPPGWREFAEGQRRRAAGEESVSAYRAASLPLARYGLVVQGEDSAAEVLPLVPGAFFGQRLRAWQAIERFRRREIAPAVLLQTLAQVERAGYRCAAMEHFKRLAQGDLSDLGGGPGPMRDNAALVALERGDGLPAADYGPGVRAVMDREAFRRAVVEGRAVGPAERLFTADARELAREHPHLARLVEVYDAAARGDVSAVITLLEAHEGPLPRFVVTAVEALVLHRPGDAKALSRWGGPPADAPPAWWLHLAARALAGGDALAAYRAVERASQVQGLTVREGASAADAVEPLPDGRGSECPDGAAVNSPGREPWAPTPWADPLRRLAEADAVARAFPAAGLKPERLLGLVDGLHALGVTDLLDGARAKLDAVEDAPRDVRHGLAILYWRSLNADDLDPVSARRAWGHWLAIDPPPVLIDHLLAWHRAAIVAGLSQGRLEQARRHWDVLHSLPALKEPLAAFRDALATEYLVSTRDAMRHADAPAGYRADYERGLTMLRRLLSLDRDNVRLLTAILDTCAEWFLDFYNAEDHAGMAEQVARHRPLADHLARLIAERPGELSARAALAEFLKFRGFLESDPQARIALYREALKWNPHNDNVQSLLEELEGDDES